MATIIDIPHALGRDEAKRRMKARVGNLAAKLPGGAATVTSSWLAEDRMRLDIVTMGQTIAAVLDVEDRLVRVSLDLPPMLAFMSGAIAAIVKRSGEELLLPGGETG